MFVGKSARSAPICLSVYYSTRSVLDFFGLSWSHNHCIAHKLDSRNQTVPTVSRRSAAVARSARRRSAPICVGFVKYSYRGPRQADIEGVGGHFWYEGRI